MPLANLAQYKEDLNKLIVLGSAMDLDLLCRISERNGELDDAIKKDRNKVTKPFEENYQRWYTEAFTVLRQILPDRLTEFEAYYRVDPRRKNIQLTTFTIQD
jgi:hypothetical protein